MDRHLTQFQVLICGICLLGGLIFTVKTAVFLKNADTVEATVTGAGPKSGAPGWWVHLTYKWKGEIHEAEFPMKKESVKLGEIYPLYISPENPENAKRKSFLSLWIFPICFFAIGMVVPLFAAGAKAD